jgi:hypothetical protein
MVALVPVVRLVASILGGEWDGANPIVDAHETDDPLQFTCPILQVMLSCKTASQSFRSSSDSA